MDETRQPADSTLNLKEEDVGRFLTDKGWGNIDCDVCKNSKFYLTSFDNTPEPLHIQSANRAPLGEWPYALTCTNCGNMRFINGAIIVEWVNKRNGVSQ